MIIADLPATQRIPLADAGAVASMIWRESKRSLVWRGMGDSRWCPNTSLDRFMAEAGLVDRRATKTALQGAFQLSMHTIGESVAADEDEFWATAQHIGLPSPFLDWSSSPWIALYFACSSPAADPRTQKALLLALNADGLPMDKTSDLRKYVPAGPFGSRRLPAQRGLFTETDSSCILDSLRVLGKLDRVTAYTFPMTAATELLSSLRAMNIRDVSLFPDVTGAIREARAIAIRGDS